MTERVALAQCPQIRTADTLPRSGPDGDALIVVATGPDVPGWVVESCLRTGREVRIEPAAGAPAARIQDLARLAGRSVLLTGPPSQVRSGTRQVVAAVREMPTDAAVLTEATAAAAQLDATLVAVHGVPLSFGERSVGLSEALSRGRNVLQAATERLAATAPGIAVESRLLRVHPYELVGEGVDADLLVLGGPRPRIPARVGLVGSSAVYHAPCPVLMAARPA